MFEIISTVCCSFMLLNIITEHENEAITGSINLESKLSFGRMKDGQKYVCATFGIRAPLS